jgi:pyruvate dehydrogenase E1 component alpha subunit
LECQTYRHYGHSKSDPATYRPEGELDRWKERDPLAIARTKLLESGLSEDEVASTEEAVKRELADAVEAALAAPYPDPADPATEFAPA